MARTKRWMTKTDFDAWVAALRSGEYRQAKGVSCEWDPWYKAFTMCATGVALDVCVDGEWQASPGSHLEGHNRIRYSIPVSTSVVFGTEGREAAMRVQSMNDRGGWSFNGLAEWIVTRRKQFCGK